VPNRPAIRPAAEADDQEHSLDPAVFTDGLARSLADGSFRLVIVLDTAPDELVQVVGYLQSVTDKIDIDLVTVAAYEVNGSQVLVPQRIEPARRVRERSDAQVHDRQQAGTLYPGSAEFRQTMAAAPASRRDLLQRLADWADTLQAENLVNLSSYRGKQGIVTLLPRLASDNAGLVTIYSDAKSAYLQFWRGVFERRAPQSIPAVQAALGAELRQGNTTHVVSEQLLQALTSAYREAVGKSNQTGPATASVQP
jgi:hypothetical protein